MQERCLWTLVAVAGDWVRGQGVVVCVVCLCGGVVPCECVLEYRNHAET